MGSERIDLVTDFVGVSILVRSLPLSTIGSIENAFIRQGFSPLANTLPRLQLRLYRLEAWLPQHLQVVSDGQCARREACQNEDLEEVGEALPVLGRKTVWGTGCEQMICWRWSVVAGWTNVCQSTAACGDQNYEHALRWLQTRTYAPQMKERNMFWVARAFKDVDRKMLCCTLSSSNLASHNQNRRYHNRQRLTYYESSTSTHEIELSECVPSLVGEFGV